MSEPSSTSKAGDRPGAEDLTTEQALADGQPGNPTRVVVTDEDETEGGSAWSRARQRLSEASAQVGSQVNGKVSDLREQRDRRAGQQAAAAAASTGATSATGVATTSATGAGVPAARRTRKARLRLARVDPWSVMKTMLLFSVAGAIVFFIATWVVWGVINAMGVFDSVNKAVNDLVASPGAETTFRLEDFVNTHRILGFAALIGALDVVLLTALATLGAFLYNLAATVMGGLEVTLAED